MSDEERRLLAAVELLGRSGAAEFQLRFSDDEKPVVWSAVARWGDTHEAAGGMSPLHAVNRLCETVIDGGKCSHCHQPTSFIADETFTFGPLGKAMGICTYKFDPELATYRRSCEGVVR